MFPSRIWHGLKLPSMRIGPVFRDRADAGRKLAQLVVRSAVDTDSLVLALPRGGVPVGFELASALQMALDVFLVRKLGFPAQEELAIGAIASGGVRVLNEALIRELQVSSNLIEQLTAREDAELRRREQLYRQGRPAQPIRGRVVIVVDDGLATGASMKAAARAVRLQEPKRVIVAVPIAAKQTCHELRLYADDVVCVHTPEPFVAVGVWYEDFGQTTDDEVQDLLKRAEERLLNRGLGTREN